MRTHPNTILMAVLKPNSTTRATLRAMTEHQSCCDKKYESFKIGGNDYTSTVMESDYDEGYQISADEGDIVIHSFLTYGYGEAIDWENLVEKKTALEQWAIKMCKLYQCSYKIQVTANYW